MNRQKTPMCLIAELARHNNVSFHRRYGSISKNFLNGIVVLEEADNKYMLLLGYQCG